MGRVLSLGVLLIVAAVGCHTITEELPPATHTTGPTPVIVNPPPGNTVLIIPPGPTPAPPPQQSPSPPPNPSPSTTPPPPSQPNNNPATAVFVSVTSYLRDGTLYKKGAQPAYKPGDVLYLTCTPKDSSGKPTKNHGPLQDWRISSGNGADFFFTDTNTFNPDIHVNPNSGAGSIEASCRVDDIRSSTLTMNIQP